jgi:hypothetical protein
VFVKHWHGYQSGGYYGGDAMSIQVGDEVLTINANGYVHNVDVTGLPGCAPDTTPSVDGTCSQSPSYDDWGYWDFTGGGEDGACNEIDTSELSVTLLDGNNNLFFEASNCDIYPVTLTVDPTTFCSAVASTSGPTSRTTSSPTSGPTSAPTRSPTSGPTSSPTSRPSTSPSAQPSMSPSAAPSSEPSASPSTSPSAQPSTSPSAAPSSEPSASPSTSPSAQPSTSPSAAPSSEPSASPSVQPSTSPSAAPSSEPSASPSTSPSTSPSAQPSTSPSSAPSFESVSHDLCDTFAVHARTTVTFDGEQTTVYGGDVGVFPGTSITGTHVISLSEQGAGSSEAFAASVLVAHSKAMQESSVPMHIEIGGLTFTPGTYRSDSAINFAYGTVVTLDGDFQANPKFLFIAGSTLVTAADTSFILINGAKAENVLWALGTAATLGAKSVVEGSILAGTAITFGTKSVLHGCALAQSAVTFESGGSIVTNHYIADGPGNLRGLRR